VFLTNPRNAAVNKARRKEIERAAALVAEAAEIIRLVGEEEREAFENLPESLQGGERGQTMSDAADNLDMLERIAISDDSCLHKQMRDKLAALGLIEVYTERLPGWPPCDVYRARVPLPVHIRWCEWCAAQPDDGPAEAEHGGDASFAERLTSNAPTPDQTGGK
jgi:hypothetical protein